MSDIEVLNGSGERTTLSDGTRERIHGGDVEGLEVFRIPKDGNVRRTASSVLKYIRAGKQAELNMLGASSVNQGFKIAVHVGAELAREGRDMTVKVGMRNKDLEDGEFSVCIMRLIVK